MLRLMSACVLVVGLLSGQSASAQPPPPRPPAKDAPAAAAKEERRADADDAPAGRSAATSPAAPAADNAGTPQKSEGARGAAAAPTKKEGEPTDVELAAADPVAAESGAAEPAAAPAQAAPAGQHAGLAGSASQEQAVASGDPAATGGKSAPTAKSEGDEDKDALAEASGDDIDDWHRWHLELALFPSLTQQQIEGPNRDDILTNDGGISTAFTFGFAPIKWIEPAIWVQFDAGSVRRATFTRPDAQGVAAEDQVVEGSWWEMWLAFMLRGRLGPAFVEFGWAPLILRNDNTRTDLPNELGETDGLFEGSRAVAYILGGGATIPVWENFDITARIQFRIRYLVSRGGEALADEEENGQMTVWPFIGAHYHF